MIERDETFGTMLRRLRRAAGLTQEELALRAALSTRGIQALETEQRRAPHRDTIERLVDALGLGDCDRERLESAARRASPAAHRPDQSSPRIPVPPTPLVGREHEIDALKQQVTASGVRLVTLMGPGGAGKTRLALEVARQLVPEFPDGVYVVSLAPISDAELILTTIAQALDIGESPNQPLMESLTTRIGNSTILFVLDNFEQLLAGAQVVADLLAACANLKVLVTSRAALRLRGERRTPVAPLRVPDLAALPPLAELGQYAAVSLFVQRAQDVYADFALTESNAAAIAEICVRLDGLPLALELAASRSNVLTPQTLLERLQRSQDGDGTAANTERLDLLANGAQDLPARQRTIRATIEWSYALLSRQTQTLFQRLGVFVDGWTMQAAEAVCALDGDLDVLNAMTALVDSSLLLPIGETVGERRFGMLETLREFALERLATETPDQGAAEHTRIEQRHAAYYLALAERAESALRGPEQVAWLDRLEAEHGNMRAALYWALRHAAPETGMRLLRALGHFWFLRGHFSEWDHWLQFAQQQVPTAGVETLWAGAMVERGKLALYLDDQTRAAEIGAACVAQFRAADDRWGLATALVVASAGKSDWDDLLQEAVEHAEGQGDAWLVAWTLHRQGQMIGHWYGDHERARAIGERSLALARQTGDAWLIARAVTSLGHTARNAHDFAAAERAFDESLRYYRHLHDRLGMARALEGLGSAAFYRGAYAEAQQHQGERLQIEQELGNRRGITAAWYWLARIALEQGDYPEAMRIAERTLSLTSSNTTSPIHTRALWLIGRSLLLQDTAERALPVLDACIDLTRQGDEVRGVFDALATPTNLIDAIIDGGWASFATDSLDVAHQRFGEAFELASANDYAAGAASALEGLAALATHTDEPTTAARLSAEATRYRAQPGGMEQPSDRVLRTTDHRPRTTGDD